jgi:hypothetical protein
MTGATNEKSRVLKIYAKIAQELQKAIFKKNFPLSGIA